MAEQHTTTEQWWQNRVVYQIYPRSFCDSNNDGIGDIPGIITKLDYLKGLGVGAIWLSPVYVSPNFDYGYDVADYCDINPEYGTLADMKQLLDEAKQRDLKIIMDLVINHTSDQHPWFKSARDSQSEYRDYYIWRSGKKNRLGRLQPPNNWTSIFTGPAWTKDEVSGQYFLHLFSKHQPDLNYNNPKVVAEIEKIMRFWLDLGVAGFRCDVINLIYKQSLTDGQTHLLNTGAEHYISTQGCHRLLQKFHNEIWQPYGAFTVGEAHNASLEDIKDFTKGSELTTAFTFDHMLLKFNYKADVVKQRLTNQQQTISWPTVFFENHDGPRSVWRFGDDKKYHYQSATMIATLLLTLRGTPFIFEGQEIGMTNAPFTNINQIKDVITVTVYAMMRRFGVSPSIALWFLLHICRDHARTPMQWSAEANAGFSQIQPWLMVNPNYRTINVAEQQHHKDSIWHYYQRLLQLRQQTVAFQVGQVEFLEAPRGVLVYDRQYNEQHYRMAVNMTGKTKWLGPSLQGLNVSSNYDEPTLVDTTQLQPYQAIIIKIEHDAVQSA